MSNHSEPISILEELFHFNSWANGRIIELSAALTDSQLDETRPMGFGSLRNTIFHNLAAEEIWLERWCGEPWRPFEMDAGGLALAAIADRFERAAERRTRLLADERTSGWTRQFHYRDARGNEHQLRLKESVLHVANHGIHHRAQALSFLKSFGKTVPGGLDFLFYRLDRPFVSQSPETTESMRKYGLSVAKSPGCELRWDSELVRFWFQYGDWANTRLMPLVEQLDDATLDRDWGMGMGTIRKTALHIQDAERWWLKNWTEGPTPFDRASETTSVREISETWRKLIEARNAFIASLNEVAASRVVTVLVGAMAVRKPVIESLVQLCGHGTHHRAQLINMLRQSGITAPPTDLSIHARELSAAAK